MHKITTMLVFNIPVIIFPSLNWNKLLIGTIIVNMIPKINRTNTNEIKTKPNNGNIFFILPHQTLLEKLLLLKMMKI